MPRTPRWPIALVAAAGAALAATLALQRIRDFDYWWHVRAGAWIAEHGAVPRVDVFTYSVAGERWVDVHWLFQLALHGIHALGGHAAVVVSQLGWVLALLAVLATIGWRRDRVWVTGLALGWMLLVAADRFSPRPEMPSFLLLGAVLALLDRHDRRGDAALYGIVPLQLLWANLHGLFALGLALVAIALVSEALRPLVSPGESLRRDRLLRLAAVLGLSVAASALNPNGLDGMLYPLEQLRMVGPPDQRGLFGSLIAELLPPVGGTRSMAPLALALFAGLAGVSLGAAALNWRRASAFDVLAWVAFLYLALGAQRNVALFAIVAAPIAVRNANEFLDRHRLPARAHAALAAAVAAALALVAGDVAADRFFLRVGSFRETGLDPFAFYYPSGAADWIERERPPGRIAHHMADGGYLVYRLWPDHPILVDGRLEIYGPETFADLMITGPDSFRRLDERFGFGTVLVHYSLIESRELLYWLWLNPNWRLVHVDETAALFAREGLEGRHWREVDVDAPDLFPPLPDERSPSDRMRRQARVNFYASLRRFGPALALWEETLERYPDLPQGALVHAWLLQQNGFTAAAEALLRQALEEHPDDALLHVRMGDLRAESGDLRAAAALYDRAIELDPDDGYALLRRAAAAEAEGDIDLALRLYSRIVATAASPADPHVQMALLRLAALQGRNGP